MIRARVHLGLRWTVGSKVATPGLWAQNENVLSKMIRKIDPRFTTVALFFPASKKGISKFRSHTFRVAVCTLTTM
jgi:hypothetical protein